MTVRLNQDIELIMSFLKTENASITKLESERRRLVQSGGTPYMVNEQVTKYKIIAGGQELIYEYGCYPFMWRGRNEEHRITHKNADGKIIYENHRALYDYIPSNVRRIMNRIISRQEQSRRISSIVRNKISVRRK